MCSSYVLIHRCVTGKHSASFVVFQKDVVVQGLILNSQDTYWCHSIYVCRLTLGMCASVILVQGKHVYIFRAENRLVLPIIGYIPVNCTYLYFTCILQALGHPE